MLMRTIRMVGASLAFAAAFAGAADAAIIALNGTRQNVSPVVGAPGGRCGAQITVVIAPGNLSATGTSNLGNFSLNESHCIAGFPPNPYTQGLFEWAFDDGATLFGTYAGAATLSATPGIFAITTGMDIGGGSGRFLGATGHLDTTGTLQLGMVDGLRVSIAQGSFTGLIDAPAIPEPGTWALMITGFGAAGVMLRRRRPQTA